MHVQARARTSASPEDVEAFLKVLSEPEAPTDGEPREAINIEGVTGTDLEDGGRIVFSFDHDREADVRAWLKEAGYHEVEFLNADAGEIFWQELGGNAPGQLLNAIRAGKAVPSNTGKRVRDVLIGQETQEPHRFYVHVSFADGGDGPEPS